MHDGNCYEFDSPRFSGAKNLYHVSKLSHCFVDEGSVNRWCCFPTKLSKTSEKKSEICQVGKGRAKLLVLCGKVSAESCVCLFSVLHVGVQTMQNFFNVQGSLPVLLVPSYAELQLTQICCSPVTLREFNNFKGRCTQDSNPLDPSSNSLRPVALSCCPRCRWTGVHYTSPRRRATPSSSSCSSTSTRRTCLRARRTGRR